MKRSIVVIEPNEYVKKDSSEVNVSDMPNVTFFRGRMISVSDYCGKKNVVYPLNAYRYGQTTYFSPPDTCPAGNYVFLPLP
jgi:hypothetical protein